MPDDKKKGDEQFESPLLKYFQRFFIGDSVKTNKGVVDDALNDNETDRQGNLLKNTTKK